MGVWEGSVILWVTVDWGTTKVPLDVVVGCPVGLCDGVTLDGGVVNCVPELVGDV